jgi:hypothetical protein
LHRNNRSTPMQDQVNILIPCMRRSSPYHLQPRLHTLGYTFPIITLPQGYLPLFKLLQPPFPQPYLDNQLPISEPLSAEHSFLFDPRPLRFTSSLAPLQPLVISSLFCDFDRYQVAMQLFPICAYRSSISLRLAKSSVSMPIFPYLGLRRMRLPPSVLIVMIWFGGEVGGMEEYCDYICQG